ncbi:MAG TPA: hypothetical protein PKY10_14620 [Lentisphaeria bacterium]|nr:hypothetical protein [Lentisphaeria bacterium]
MNEEKGERRKISLLPEMRKVKPASNAIGITLCLSGTAGVNAAAAVRQTR